MTAGMLLSASQSILADGSLLMAAWDGDIATLQSILKDQVDVNSAQADGSTALAWAVYGDHGEAVDLLIHAGADVNAANIYGVTPLYLACENRSQAVVRKLLEAGADPNYGKETGETPLMMCAGTGAVDAVKLLLRHGANVNAKEHDEDQTALMWAVAGSYTEVVRELLAHGADVHARSKVILEPEPYVIDIDQAVLGSNYPPTVRFSGISGGFTAMHFAAQQGDVETARLLLEAGADVNSPHQELGSALVITIAGGHEDLALFLLQKGANPNLKDAWGITPLHYALYEGVLILNNYKPASDDHLGWTRKNMPKLVEVLLGFGADPNARIEYSYVGFDNLFLGRTVRGQNNTPQIDPVGATPLLVAAAAGDVESMRILEKVSDPSATTIGGATVFMLAAGAGAEHGVRHEKEALEAAKFALAIGGGSVNDHLTERAAGGVNKGKEDGRTALHFVSFLGWTSMVGFLAEQGADLNVKDRYGMTPLLIALGDPEIRYVTVGDVVTERDFRIRTSADGKGNEKLAELIVELGAEPFTGEYQNRAGD